VTLSGHAEVGLQWIRNAADTELSCLDPPQGPEPTLLLPILVASLAVTQLPPGRSPADATPIVSGDTAVILRSGAGDEAIAEQVRRVLPSALRAAGRWGTLPAPVTLTIHATHGELESAIGRPGSPWMRAWARLASVDLQSPRTWSRGHASDGALTQILVHELAHCVLLQAAGRDGRARKIPLWFQEGMASVAAEEHHDRVHPDAVADPAPFLRTDPKVAYGTADRAFRDLVQRFGAERVKDVIARLANGHAFQEAFRDATGVTLVDFEADLVRRLSAVAQGH
jgi:hypothetical protein